MCSSFLQNEIAKKILSLYDDVEIDEFLAEQSVEIDSSLTTADKAKELSLHVLNGSLDFYSILGDT